MPEGDTIFRSARNLHRALAGKPVTVFRSTYPTLTRVHDDTPLTGQLVSSVEARGKWLLIHFSGGATLVTHMLMNGSWHIYRHGEQWRQPRTNMRIVIENSDYLAVGFKVPVAEMHTAQSLERDRRFPTPARDLLNPAFDPAEAALRIAACRSEEIGDVLLHQQVIAGIGNEFKSEICFVTGVSPFAKVADLTQTQIEHIVAVSHNLLKANVVIDTRDSMVTYRVNSRRTTHATNPTESVWVYGRRQQPCRTCSAPIRRRIQGPDARVTYWCPLCQPMPDGSDIDG